MWEQFLQVAELFGNAAAVLTGAIAVILWLRLKGDDRKRVTRLEEYLKGEREAQGRYQHSATHLSARLGMTEAQVFQAAVTSIRIESLLGQDEQGFANRILFQYATGDPLKDLELDGLRRSSRQREGTRQEAPENR